jgi:uncharacterized membrane protein
MLQHGKSVFWLLTIGLAAYLLATLERLPAVVASHFNAAGVPNGWSSRPTYALLLLVIGVLLPLGVVGLLRGMTRDDLSSLNMPAREYWNRPEHREEGVRRVRGYVWWLGCLMSATAVVIHSLVLAAHTQEPPRLSTSTFLATLGAILLGIIGWSVGWYRLLRQPR